MDRELIPLDPLPHIEAYKPGIDRTLLRRNMELTPEQRLRKLQDFVRFMEELRRSGERSARQLTSESRHLESIGRDSK